MIDFYSLRISHFVSVRFKFKFIFVTVDDFPVRSFKIIDVERF